MIGDQILSRGCVQVRRAVLRVETIDFVGDRPAAMRLLQLLQSFGQGFNPRCVGPSLLPTFGVEKPAGVGDLVQNRTLLRKAFRSDRLRSLEHHVFQQVRHARFSFRFIDGSRTVTDVERNSGALVPFEQKDREAVGENVLLHPFFKIKSGKGQRPEEQQERGCGEENRKGRCAVEAMANHVEQGSFLRALRQAKMRTAG